MVTPTTTIMRIDTMMSILMSPKCPKLLKNFYFTSGMPLMKEWCMKCKICMKTRKFILYLLNIYNFNQNLYFIRFPKLSDQFFDKAPWPSENEVRTIMDDDKVLYNMI